MTNQFTQESHPGNFPTRILRYNITDHFANVRDTTYEYVLEGVSSGKVNAGIEVDIDRAPIRTPFADCETKIIHLQESFIGFMWALSYSMFVIHEEGVQKKLLANQFRGQINFDSDLLKRAKALFDWAITLKDEYSDWDPNLPNPESFLNDTEKWYAEKVNGIFSDAITYDLFHEFSHLVNNHCEGLGNLLKKEAKKLTVEERALYKQIETEADNNAFDSIIQEFDSEKYKLHKGLAIIIAHVASLFIIKNPRSVKQIVHPDIDNRISNSIERLNLDEDADSDYVWSFGALACKFFFDNHGIPTDLSDSATTKELFFRYLNKFDELKSEQF